MLMWLFFTIFGLVLFIPTLILFLFLNRLKNTIIVLIKQNGALIKIVINNKILEKGQITEIKGKKIKPIKISKEEIYFGKWRRWIIKPELDSTTKSNISDREIEEYLNNEDLIKLYLAGKFKETLLWLIGATLFCVIIVGVINGYITKTHECKILLDNSTRDFFIETTKAGIKNITGV